MHLFAMDVGKKVIQGNMFMKVIRFVFLQSRIHDDSYYEVMNILRLE